jgi:hypothetical protein
MILLKRIPAIKGVIKRRLLVNFRAKPSVVQRILPAPFRPKLQSGFAIAGICLIRLEQIRPAGLPGFFGLSSENAAHRIAVEWTDKAGMEKEGVFIPRRDTDSTLNHLAGGRLFPGEHSPAQFWVVDVGGRVELSMRSLDETVAVNVAGQDSDQLPASSCFDSLAEASSFFERGNLGYSATRDGDRLDGLLLRTWQWRVRVLTVTKVHSSYFADLNRFPEGTIEFDHALIMRDIPHQWQTAEDLQAV